MELKIPIEVDFDDMKAIVDDLGKLQTYKCFEGAEEVLVDIEDVAKVLMDHVKAKKSVKGDMISRADAVDAISKIKRTDNWQAAVSMALMDLPSAQPTLTNAESNTELSVDLISRADALSCFHDWIDRRGDVHTADEMPEYQRIEQLPSAQPEVIRCKDCVLTDGYEPIADGRYWCMLHGAYMHYCSDAERRTDE